MSETKKQETEDLNPSRAPVVFGPQRSPSSPGRVESQSKAIKRELEAMHSESSFVCSRCGAATWERERAPGTTECVFC